MRYAFHELDAFKRISFKNMTGCYREELERLLRGEIATRVLTRARFKEASVIDQLAVTIKV